MTPKENKVLQKARDVYKGRLTTFYEETIRKTADELERTLTELEELKKEHTLTIKLFNEANEKLNTLERDVARYFELWLKWSRFEDLSDSEKWELGVLKGKLLKVGKEE